MAYKYAFKDYNAETMARCVVLAASVSTKHCIEICNHIKGRDLTRAKEILNDAIELKTAIPFKRFNHGIGHKKGIGPARFAVKACTEMINGLKSCEANASNKGLNTSELIINHINAQMAARPWHYGRARRRKTKRTHIEIVLAEKDTGKKRIKPSEEKTIKKTTEKTTEKDTKEKAIKTEVKTTKKTDEKLVKTEALKDKKQTVVAKKDDVTKNEKTEETVTKKDIQKDLKKDTQKEQKQPKIEQPTKKQEEIKKQDKQKTENKEEQQEPDKKSTENSSFKDLKKNENIKDKPIKNNEEVKQDEPKNTVTKD